MKKTNLLFRKSEAGFPKRKQSRRKRLILSKKKQSPKKKADFDKKNSLRKKRLILTKKVSYPKKNKEMFFQRKKSNQIFIT